MATTTLNTKTLELYYNFLNGLDKNSKKILISKLKESLNAKKKDGLSLNELYGAWQDSRDADDIINEIRNSNVNKFDIEEL